MSFTAGILPKRSDAFISRASSLEPGEDLHMISISSQIAPSRPMPMPDACLAL
jgi:hypothetical protein